MSVGRFALPLRKCEDPDPAIFCPAEGYILPEDCPVPDPEIICPIDGWVKPESPYTPPVETPTPDNEEIILLCDRSGEGFVSVTGIVTPGKITYILEDAITHVVLNTQELSSYVAFKFDILTYPDTIFFLVRIKPSSAGSTISRVYTLDESGYTKDWPIIYADFTRASNITSFDSSFKNILKFKRIDFPSNLDNCTSFRYTFQNSGLLWVFFPQLPEVTTMYGVCYDCYDLILAYLPEELPEVTAMTYAFRNCSSLIEHTMPKKINKCTDIRYYLYGASSLKTLKIWEEAALLSNIGYAFMDLVELESWIIVKDTPSISSFYNMFYNCTKLPHLEFQVEESIANSCQYIARDCDALQYLELPRSMPNVSSFTGFITAASTGLYRLIMPDEVNYNGMINCTTALQTWPLLKQVEGNMACGPNTYWNFATASAFQGLTSFNKPLAKFDQLYLGGSLYTTKITYVEVDWTNSPWRDGKCISFGGLLNTTEIDRIFTSLPLVAGTQEIDVRNNPGYATCDPTIATVKGWSVL